MYDLRPALGLAVALLALPAAAEAAPARAAGWHGREIRAPYPHYAADVTTSRFPHGWSAGPVRHGTGFARPSARVRELQQRLLRRGYRPGAADGRFGARTRAAVLWFQIKHSLPRTGRGDAATITRLRDPRRPVRLRDAAPLPAITAAVTIPPEAGIDAPATVLLALVILVGLAVIAAWLRPALRSTESPVPVRTVELNQPRAALTVLGYVALAEDGDLDTAARTLGVWCEARGWPLAKVVHDTLPAHGRPGLQHVLDEIHAGRAAGVVVERLRDLTGSLTELGPLLQWFVDADAFVIALDYELDTSSHSGELAARALVELSVWERGRVAGRTRPGLDATRRGVASGAAVRDDPELSARIVAMRSGGMSLQAIADALNDAGVPTLRGGARWRPSSVQAATGYKRPHAKTRGVELPRRKD